MKNYRYIALSILMSLALSVSARTFYQGEELYVNAQQSFNWADASALLMLYLYNGDDATWLDLEHVDGSFYKAVFPAQCTFNKVTIVRKKPSNPSHAFDGDVWNKKEDLDLADTWNCLYNFDDASNRWKLYAPPASAIPSVTGIESSGVLNENIKICESAWDDPFSLRVKLNSDSTDYDYSSVTGHGWYYSYDGSTWTAIEPAKTGVATNDMDNEKDLNKNMLPSKPVGEEIYYYLYSSLLSGRRLIHLTTDAPKCGLDCSITSFETAVSNVNADDNTYTLDGIVAFGKASGSLVISCGSKDTTIVSPKSPQAFSLNGLPATSVTGQTANVTASFTGDGSCSKKVTFDVPNIVEAVKVFQKDILIGDPITLTPENADPVNDYVWVDDKNVEYKKTQNFPVPASAFETAGTKEYIYKEYYKLSGNMDDLMANGNYESGTPQSDYDNWGTFPETSSTQINFYDNETVNPSHFKDNGFAIVQNAHYFYPTYATVTAKEGNNFALFDAKTGVEGGNKKAWYATTTDNSNLKLKEGTRYVLSFWAANINNYGEMDNAARFKFYIEDITGPSPVRIDSSGVLDLSLPEFRNNIWHQCSETFLAKKNCDKVRISVVNLNTNVLNVGNDFALDDIQFHAISTVTKVVKSQQKFVVVAHEPKIDAFTATVVPLLCDEGPAYTIKMHVKYQNPKGNLVIRNTTTGVDSVFSVSGDWDVSTAFDKDFIITSDKATHNWEVFFDGWTDANAPKKTATTVIPGFPKIQAKNYSFSNPVSDCATTTTLTFDLDYTYQQGKLHYSISGLSGDSIKTITKSKTEQKLTGLKFENIPADGQVRTLHVTFDGDSSCTKNYTLPAAPFSPVIGKVEISGLPSGKLSCSTSNYDINVNVTTHYNAGGHKIVLKYNDNGTEQTKTVNADKNKATTTIPLTLSNMGAGKQTITAYLDEASSCAKGANYTAPELASITPGFDVKVGETACGELKYTVSGTVNYDMPDGTLIVEFDAAHRDVITVASGSTSSNFSISNMTAIGSDLTLKAWFEKSTSTPCSKVTSKTFAAPTIPSMTINPVTLSDPSCELNGSVTFDVNYTYQQGNMLYKVDGLEAQTKAITERNTGSLNTGKLTVSGFPADGLTHKLYVQFDGANSCEDSVEFVAPLSYAISSVDISDVPATILCDQETYTASVSIVLPYDKAIGKNLLLHVEGKNIPVAVTANPVLTTVTLTKVEEIGLSVSARFADAPSSCAVISNPYDAPVRLTCGRDTAHICEGDKYTWHDTVYTPAAEGTYTYGDNKDTLILFVHAQPKVKMLATEKICEKENEIRLPYTVTGGAPNLFDIVIGKHKFRETRKAADTIVLVRPADMQAGTYTAHITVRDSLADCFSTAQATFTISEPDRMYRKWDDLIFIDNASGDIKEYLWYVNGVAQANETGQVLHDPKGLTGTYFCRLITADNDTLYTCETAFEDIPRSRDADADAQHITVSPTYVRANTDLIIRQTGGQQLFITLYDSTGKLMTQHTQQQAEGTLKAPTHEGVYIVRIQYGDDVQTSKIMVYE